MVRAPFRPCKSPLTKELLIKIWEHTKIEKVKLWIFSLPYYTLQLKTYEGLMVRAICRPFYTLQLNNPNLMLKSLTLTFLCLNTTGFIFKTPV